MTSDASPFWQNAFLVGVIVAMGWCVWNGWRIGLVRALVSMLGLAAGLVIGMATGSAVGAVAGAAFPVYGAVAGLVVGAGAGLMAYGIVCFLSALLFKRTAQQRTTPLRLVYGGGGALVGAFVGVSVLWGALLFVRSMGGLCEASVAGNGEFYRLPLPESFARSLVKLRKSVEAGETGAFLMSIDVMPPEFYRVMDRVGKLYANPAALQRFVAYPPIQEVLGSTRFMDLVRDPEIQEIARTEGAAALLRNPKLQDAAKDPGLIEKLQKIDIEKALDFALAEPKSPPSATRHP
jgi:hypothetical protein